MRPSGPLMLAAAMAALSACASTQSPDETAQISAQVFTEKTVTSDAAPPPPALAPFDALRAALPTFDLRRDASGPRGEVSVARDVMFPPESAILSRLEVDRLVPLQAYLRANPATTLRVEGHGDGATGEQDLNLSQSRAQAVARALLTDMKIATDRITAGAGPREQSGRGEWGRAEIILVVQP